MIESKYYNTDFYLDQQDGSFLSAQRILPVIANVFHPASVVDIGCGVGYWLKVWKEEQHVKEVMGVEGPYVTPAMLKIDPAFVQFQDLKEPVQLNRKFDLAMSLEVAEHLPASHAEQFVKSLTSLSNVVLFSAAIVGQEGTYHINEQMPEYWSRLFEKFGFVPVDYVRPLIWNMEKVDWWYKQNMLLFIHKDSLSQYPQLKAAYENTKPDYLLRIHPTLFGVKEERLNRMKTWIGYVRYRLYPVKVRFRKMFNKKSI
ncbi:hypothetical protein A4D02_34100 [Niastella koreensis]|uniref:Methyltransferase type 11 n=2 Tax=Niastella koreensis TaxID=354356 RepID=G8TDA9_NIAKG|nr:methyltransferase domain-containing protein [Niastella koreensis]AEV99349.1 hypothetical protein Niako_3019 [Niastella koreensis GR20-10]OQP45206.1 hypothetical protein A4D02_34100 [Niastella koreensis]